MGGESWIQIKVEEERLKNMEELGRSQRRWNM